MWVCPSGVKSSKRLDRPGVVRINCDVLHTWMSAAIVVADTPYVAVTDGHGHFSFNDMPLGAYDLEVWHERLGHAPSASSLERERNCSASK